MVMSPSLPPWRLALAFASICVLYIASAAANAGCTSGGVCEEDDSSLLQAKGSQMGGNSLLQRGSRVSKKEELIPAAGKPKTDIDLHPLGEKEAVEPKVLSSQSAHTEKVSWASLKHSEMARPRRQPTDAELKDADVQMAEHPLPWWKTLIIFFVFVFGICLILVLVLGCLELTISKANKMQTELINHHNAESIGQLTSSFDDVLEEEAVAELTSEDVKQMVNGDQRRLVRLLELAAPGKAEETKGLVEKAAKANKLKLSSDSMRQTCAGLEALAKAAKAMESKSAGSKNLKPKERLQHAMKQVLWAVKISKALKIPVDKEHKEKAICDNTVNKAHHADKYAEGHKDSLHGGYKDVRVGQSAITSYFASEKYVDHLAMGFVVIWSQLCAFVYAMYLKTRFPKMYAFMGPWLLVSRGEAMAAIVVTMLMVMMLSRGAITTFRSSFSWSTVLSAVIDKNILIHKWCGMLLVVYAVLHVIGHLRGSIPAIVGETDSSKVNAAFTYGTKIKFNFNTWGEAMQCWPAVTGYGLLLILIGFWALSNEKVRRKSFELFHYPHLILICLWCGMLIAHGWKQWLGVGIPLGAIGVFPIILYYFVERIFNVRAGKHETIRISDAVVKKRNVLLTIDTGNTGFQYETGHYCMLQVPEISAYQWHPFTIASGGGQRHFQVLFAIVGDWTTALSEKLAAAQKNKTPYPKIHVRGGYGAPAEGMKNKKHIVMVGGGVGATPFLSFLSNLCNSAQSDSPDAFGGVETAVFYWVSREPEDFAWINKYNTIISASDKLKSRVEVRLCLTKSLETAATEDCSAIEIAMFWMGVQVALSKFKAKSLGSELGAPTQFGRPNWKKEFAGIATKLLAKSRKILDEEMEVSVFACGNQMLVNSLEEACDETDKLSDCIDFRLYAEEF